MKMSRLGRLSMLLGALAIALPHAFAQISLTTAVDLALRDSPKIKMAQAELLKAKAALSESKDAFIPNIGVNAGVGKSTGPPLSVPTAFSASAQSLVFSFSQPDYIRAAQAGIAAAELGLNEARNGVMEDTVSTYVGLDNAQRRRAAVAEAATAVASLVRITQDRYSSGVDALIDLHRVQRIGAQLNLQRLLLDDEIEGFEAHLGQLTGMTATRMQTVPASIPFYAESPAAYAPAAESDGIRAAFANARSKEYAARGDARYRWRPQLGFGANYSRIYIGTGFNNYSDYYPGFAQAAQQHGLNSLSLGIQITVPLLDVTHQARARSAMAEAIRLRYEAEDLKSQFIQGRAKLSRTVAELSARAELAARDRDIAQDDLDAVRLQLASSASAADSTPLTPKDEQKAMLHERQLYIDMLSGELQLRQTEITLMRQQGSLGEWLRQAVATPAASVQSGLPSAPIRHP